MKKITLLSITTILLLLFSSISFSQTANLGILSTFESFTGAGSVANSGGTINGDSGTFFGSLSGGNNGDQYIGDAVTDQARKDLMRLYIHLNDLFVDYPNTHAAAFGAIGAGETLTPGVYSIASAGSVGTILNLDGGGDPDAFFVIKFAGAFTVGANSIVNLTNGTQSCNVFYIAAGAISVAADADIKGTLFSKGGAVGLAANVILEGRMLTTAGAITLAGGASASQPPCTTAIEIFCEAACVPAAAVDVLGSVSDFMLFSSAGNVANTGISGVNGNIGTNSGTIAGYTTGIHIGNEETPSTLTATAAADLDNAYTALMALTVTGTHAAAFGAGETLSAGVYDMAAGSLGGTITLDGGGDSDAIFVMRFAGAFNVASGSKVILANGASRCNIFWIGGAGVVTGAVNIGANSIVKGTFLSHGGACNSGVNVFLAGRQFSTGGAVNTNAAILYTNPECVTSTPLLDTDGDGIPDFTDTDDDGDGINDADEALIGTDPLLIDTDGDGNSDGVDDFDDDGIDNATESDENSEIVTDTTPADGFPDITDGVDTDSDGTPDITDTDDDGDGINDADEALIGTDPLLFDTDGDGNSDGVDDFDNDGIDNATESDENSGIVTDTTPVDGNPDITFDNTTLSVDNYSIRNVVIHPNPFNDRISIHLSSDFDNDSFEIKLLDLNGRVISNNKSQSVNGLISIENLNNLKQGVYFIMITNSSDGESNVSKLIKN
ncbi:ice-binding family protein [Lacinutrix sp. Bg11-31]|uniref:ice-binding family protein n=1 Tax=Lacinutrix sp. Bg11-31 TaxID=2057808 RepID=UPI000C305435|nr:ice-binding family protein [Lacinutrix sp. Bg11-31]AUC82720.1 hypothetical protein CW733_11540 [Lacinutrix sp. Bg11-31]